jgi:hypothetical protein
MNDGPQPFMAHLLLHVEAYWRFYSVYRSKFQSKVQ